MEPTAPAQTAKSIASWDAAQDAWIPTLEQDTLPTFEHLDVFSETFPTSGMTLNGEAYALPTWDPATDDSASSSLPDGAMLGTPTSRMWKGAGPQGGATQIRNKARGLIEAQVMDIEPRLFKTPTSQLAVNGGSQHPDKRKAGGHGPTLADEIEHLLPKETDMSATPLPGGQSRRLLPTPTVGMMMGGSETRSGARNGEKLLPGVVKDLLPTPRASDGEKGGPNQKGSKGDLMLPSAVTRIGASMNPPSDAGKESSDGELPGQLSLLDAMVDTA